MQCSVNIFVIMMCNNVCFTALSGCKVVCLREAEHRLRLHCEELELHAGEQEVVLRELEVAMERLALDADRRLTQQHRDHQNDIQLLLQKLKGEEIRSAFTTPLKQDIFVLSLYGVCKEIVSLMLFQLLMSPNLFVCACLFRGWIRRGTAGYARETAASGERTVFLQKLQPAAEKETQRAFQRHPTAF